MMLMSLLTELTRLEVKLSADPDGLKVDAPAGALSEELRQAMMEHKAALLRFARFPYVQTIDGLGMLTGHTKEQDVSWVAPERQDALRYKKRASPLMWVGGKHAQAARIVAAFPIDLWQGS